MAKLKNMEFDGVVGSEVRDSQGELLSVAGADISDMEAGRGIVNIDHAQNFYNLVGRVTEAKKIFSEADCSNERHKYYWDKIKSPYIYARAYLFDADQHPHAQATAAIIRNIHKTDSPLKLKASVEGGVIQRDVRDPTLLARTKVKGFALTFVPANNATLIEGLGLSKNNHNEAADYALMRSIAHLAKTDVPSFRTITRHASASTIIDNVSKIQEMAESLGLDASLVVPELNELLNKAISEKIASNIYKIQEMTEGLTKALTAGYNLGKPTSLTGGGVLQVGHVPMGRDIKYTRCDMCGHDQVYMPNQTRCRSCKQSFPFDKLASLILK